MWAGLSESHTSSVDGFWEKIATNGTIKIFYFKLNLYYLKRVALVALNSKQSDIDLNITLSHDFINGVLGKLFICYDLWMFKDYSIVMTIIVLSCFFHSLWGLSLAIVNGWLRVV